jgi:hypothetical protein
MSQNTDKLSLFSITDNGEQTRVTDQADGQTGVCRHYCSFTFSFSKLSNLTEFRPRGAGGDGCKFADGSLSVGTASRLLGWRDGQSGSHAG